MSRLISHPSLSAKDITQHLEAIKQLPNNATIIKDKRGQSIYQCSINNDPIIIKKYKLSSFKRKLSTILRHSRAERSLRAATAFKKNSIPTPSPHIVIIKGPLIPHTAYISFTQFDGNLLTDYIAQNPQNINTVISQISDTFKKMASAKISHGDLHVLNILVDHNASISIIDLDGTRMHKSKKRHLSCYKKDRHRIIKTAKEQISHEFANLLTENIPPTP